MRRVLLCGAALLVSACAAVQNMSNALGRGDLRGAVAAGDQLEKERAGLQAEADRCKELEHKVVTYDEETQIGGAVALALASKAGAVYIELSPELGAGKVASGRKPKPGTGAKTDLTRYVNELGKGLAAYSERPAIAWTFAVLDSPTPNAFSAPGGYVFVTTGMIKQVANEAQLAGVLAHEIGHVVHRDAINQYKLTKSAACKAAFLAKMGASAVAGAADQLVGEFHGLLSVPVLDLGKASSELIEKLTDGVADSIVKNGFSADTEFSADETAVELMIFAGYDPRQFQEVLKGPEGGFFSPHPSNADRAKRVAAEIAKNSDFASGLQSPALPAQTNVVRR